MTFRLITADCVEAMAAMEEASVDAIVTDPPAGIAFMNKHWDAFAGRDGFVAFLTAVMRACYRVLKPGGHAVVWALPRTAHWTGWAIEEAGFEVRDVVMHLFGSGFPKSLNLDGEWQGWGTALKPASEHWILARRPLVGTVAQNVLAHGTGALNIDGTRIETNDKTPAPLRRGDSQSWFTTSDPTNLGGNDALGRWPANVVLDEEAARLLDEQSGEASFNRSGVFGASSGGTLYGNGAGIPPGSPVYGYGDRGGASRFFYVAKSDREERNRGLAPGERSTHPTHKPVELMQWLCRLVTPPHGKILDPFCGSGSTGMAALREGFDFIGIEREPEYVDLARARIVGDGPLFNVEVEGSVIAKQDRDR